jgi:Leucine-rich repeat (LRR) protein
MLNNLSLSHNNIVDISPLVGLTMLDWLTLHHNKIVDVEPLLANWGINSGDWLLIEKNSLDCGNLETLDILAALEERGVNIRHDCP